MSITLKVKPEVLRDKAKSISSEIASIEKDINMITSKIEGTKKYWRGDASEKHRNDYEKSKDEINKVIKRLKEHPVDLQVMAGVYEQTEAENQQLAKTLPTNVLI